ncbi:MAG: hypothetical protein K5872_22070 [Rhizobiaceae bacterium]|nr:hypothetical protein [Rhizobiaceae bacterium]MCV0408907.1 hypothetical protein [Rhizobiaceae bacterium]
MPEHDPYLRHWGHMLADLGGAIVMMIVVPLGVGVILSALPSVQAVLP